MKELHKEYIDELNGLQDKEGKDIAEAFLSIFQSMAKASKGNIKKMLAMIRLSRKKLIRDAVGLVKESQGKARELGKEFGQVKLNAIEANASQ
jgi:hypothetical protein